MATRFLADENFPYPVTDALRRLGHDVLTLSDLGLAGQSLTDSAVLKMASDDLRTVLTLNRRDFVRLHRASSDHGGIVACSFDLDFEGQAERIRIAIGDPRPFPQLSANLLHGTKSWLERLWDEHRSRSILLRLLPEGE